MTKLLWEVVRSSSSRYEVVTNMQVKISFHFPSYLLSTDFYLEVEEKKTHIAHMIITIVFIYLKFDYF